MPTDEILAIRLFYSWDLRLVRYHRHILSFLADSRLHVNNVSASAPPLDKSEDRVRRMFGQIAPNYDRMNHLLSMNTDRYWRFRTVHTVRPTGQDPILDVCTGTGDLALAWLKKTGGKIPIVATDFCDEMLIIADQKKTSAPNQEQLTFQQADTQELPFDDDTFQIVSVAFGLRNVTDTDRGLQEMARVCRPQGQVVILEFSTPTWQPMKAIYGWYFRNVLPKIGQRFARNDEEAYAYLPESVGQFPQGEALAERMRCAGLSSVRIMPFTFGIATLYVGVK